MKKIAVVLLMLSACSMDDLTKPTAVREVEEAIRYKMRDPDSTQFREVARCTYDEAVFQGELNTRNHFGGYEGFVKFYYADGELAFVFKEAFEDLKARCLGLPSAQENNFSIADTPSAPGTETVSAETAAFASREQQEADSALADAEAAAEAEDAARGYGVEEEE